MSDDIKVATPRNSATIKTRSAASSHRNVDDTNTVEDNFPRHSTANKSKSALSSHYDRELVNKSRNGYYGTSYIQNVTQYFDHDKVEGDEKQKKQYLGDLLADFRRLLEDTKDGKTAGLHDVEFVESVGDDQTAIAAHRQLLVARSATFEALFNSDEFINGQDYLGFKLISTDEEHVKKILLPNGKEGVKIDLKLMEAVLHYMYWGYVEKNLEESDEFYEVASFLDLKELRRQLAENLYNKLYRTGEETDAIKYLKLSVKCDCKYLKRKTIDYIVSNKAVILKSDEWKHLSVENKNLAKEVYDKIVEESRKN